MFSRLAFALALVAVSAFNSSARPSADRFGVTYVPGANLREEIEKAPLQAPGSAWADYFRKPSYGAVVVRRTKPGQAEVHTALTDIWYVIDGSGTLVTGGSLVKGKQTERGELRGSSIAGGIERHIRKGDLIDIPAGTPHWVKAIAGKELVYLTVKVKTR